MNIRILIFISFIVLSCTKSEKVLLEKNIDGKIHHIEINALLDIVLIEDSISRLFIEGDVEIIKNLEIKYENGFLQLDLSKKSFFYSEKREIKVTIHHDTLDELKINAPSDVITGEGSVIHSDDLIIWSLGDLGHFDLKVACRQIHFKTSYSNTGNYVISGTCYYFFPWIYSAVNLDASSLNSTHIRLIDYSFGDVYLKPDLSLKIEKYSDGNVYYSGNPEIDFTGNTSNIFKE